MSELILHHYPSSNFAEKVRAAAERSVPTVRAHLALLESMLAHESSFVLGEEISAADIALYHVVWFLARGGDPLELLAGNRRIEIWAERVAALGHAESTPMLPQQALALARDATPTLDAEDRDLVSTERLGNPAGLDAGDWVHIEPLTEVSPAQGRLVALDDERAVIATQARQTGEVHVYFPREGYRIRPGR